MTGPRTEGWVDISRQVRYLERIISDMEWEDRDASAARRELEHYHNLAKQGEIWEPPF